MYAMTPMIMTGFYKILPSRDFPMQIYLSYIMELCILCLPLIVIQLINNALLGTWSIESILCLSILGLNLILDMRGIIVIGDEIN